MDGKQFDPLYRKLSEFRARRRAGGSTVRTPAFVQRGAERWGRTTIPYPRLSGLAAGIVGLLLVMFVAQLLIGGPDLGADGPQPWGYLEE